VPGRVKALDYKIAVVPATRQGRE